MVTINNRVKEIRVQKRITQEELAKAAGITRPYLSDIERGVKNNPSGAIVIKIANYLGLPVEEIFFTNDVKHSEQGTDSKTEKTA